MIDRILPNTSHEKSSFKSRYHNKQSCTTTKGKRTVI